MKIFLAKKTYLIKSAYVLYLNIKYVPPPPQLYLPLR